MTTGSLLVTLALFLIVAVLISRPFFRPAPRRAPISERELLIAQKEALLARLDALDFDVETAKQDQEAYQAERQYLIASIEGIEEKLSALPEEDIDAAIQAAISRLRQPQAAADESGPNFCSNCGRAVDPQDRFCANCGKAIT